MERNVAQSSCGERMECCHHTILDAARVQAVVAAIAGGFGGASALFAPRRGRVLKQYGNGVGQVVGTPASKPAGVPWTYTAQRNDPCPCGSGRKFKRCCRGTTG